MVPKWSLPKAYCAVRRRHRKSAGGYLLTIQTISQEFISPLVILGLTYTLGTLSHAVLAYAIACSAACVFALLFLVRLRGVEPKMVG